MFIETKPPGQMYPKSGTSSVDVVQKRYTNKGEIIDGNRKVSVWKKQWFFCSS